MPKTWKIRVDSFININSRCILASAHVDSFPVDLPLEPNIREPNRKSSTYRQIFDSLTTEPEKFCERHSGIVLSVNKLSYNRAKTELTLELLQASEGGSDGIINGGHTVLAFAQAKTYKYDLSQAKVKITIHIGLDEDEAKDIALSSNTTAPVDSRSKANARGDYQFIKQYLVHLERQLDTKFRIAYYQNQSNAPKNPQCNVNHLIKLMNCLDVNRYNASSKSKHPRVSNNPTLSEAEEQRLAKLLPLLPKALWIEQRLFEIINKYITSPRKKGTDLASINIKKNTLLADTRYSFGFGAPADLAMPIVAAFRVFLQNDYTWVIPFEDFAEDFLQCVWGDYYKKYLINEKIKGNTVGSKICRNTEIWDRIYMFAQSYLTQRLSQLVQSSENGNRLLILR